MKLADLEPDDVPADIDQDEFARTCIDAVRASPADAVECGETELRKRQRFR